MTTTATPRQLDYILVLANKVSGRTDRYLSQARDIIGLSNFQLQRGITKAQASSIIDALKGKVAA